MPAFKNKKHCKRMIAYLIIGSTALALIFTILGTYLGSLIGAVIGWLYSTFIVWFILDHYSYLLESDEVKHIRRNISNYKNLEFPVSEIISTTQK